MTSFQFLGIPPKGEPPLQVLRSWDPASIRFPISRDPPEGGTRRSECPQSELVPSFQFLGIPPKGEQFIGIDGHYVVAVFPISRDPPEGGTDETLNVFGIVKQGVSNF